MKKAQKDQIRSGGELARKIYQAFLTRPEWVNRIRPQDIEDMIEVLEEVWSMYLNMATTSARGGKPGETSEAARKMYASYQILAALRGMQFSSDRKKENALYEAKAEAFSIYSRDN